jgi:23S rRNA (cytosine1962-C5)-methyltransferase
MELPADLPTPPGARVAVRLTADALRQVRGGHPWVFASSITSAPEGPPPGALAVVFDDRRRFAAIGLYDPSSPIRVRILQRGEPRTIDGAFWRERIGAAIERRRELLSSTTTTGMRLVHGENDALPGLVVDRYERTLVLKLYAAAWCPHLPVVGEALLAACAAAGIEVERVVLRLSRELQRGERFGLSDSMVVHGPPVEGAVTFLENGLRFVADVVGGQKTGHFLDQRDNRAMVESFAAGRRVLDVFACTGGFTVHAAAGGAAHVTSVDLSRRSLDAVTRNLSANADRPQVAAAEHLSIVGDAFEVMARLVRSDERFDLVVVDPPSFAHRAADRPPALAAYRRLADLGVELTAPRGLYVQSSCSSRITADELGTVVRAAVHASGRRSELRTATGHPIDHPVGFAQGAYLKTVVHRLEPR